MYTVIFYWPVQEPKGSVYNSLADLQAALEDVLERPRETVTYPDAEAALTAIIRNTQEGAVVRWASKDD